MKSTQDESPPALPSDGLVPLESRPHNVVVTGKAMWPVPPLSRATAATMVFELPNVPLLVHKRAETMLVKLKSEVLYLLG